MWYRTGQANFTNASTTVTGVGTSWIDGVSVGEGILGPDNRVYEIASVSSNTSLTLGSGYLGTTASNSQYQIVPTQSYIRDLAAQAAELVANYGATMAAVGTGKFEDGTATQPGVRFTADENTGIRRVTSDTMALVAGGVDRVTANTSGVSYTGTLTGGTGVVNLGSGQFVKDASGNVIIGGASAGVVGATTLYENGNMLSLFGSGTGGNVHLGAISGVSNGFQVTADTSNNLTYTWATGGVERARIDSSGNLGLGVTPSAWGSATHKAFDIGPRAALAGDNGGATQITNNAYYSGSAWVYKQNAAAALFSQDAGAYAWFTAPSGTAGNPISFTQAMTLGTTGDLTLTAGTGWLKTDGGDTGITLGANQGGGASLKYNSNGNLDITPRSGFNTVVTSGKLLVGVTTAPSAGVKVTSSGGYQAHATGGSGGGFAMTALDAGGMSFFGYTGAMGAESYSEWAQLSGGNLLVGTAASGGSRLEVAINSATSSSAYIYNSSATAGARCLDLGLIGQANQASSLFIRCGDTSAYRFQVLGNGNAQNTNNSYGAISDLKLKENITDASPKLDKLMQVRIVNYNLKSDPDKTKMLGVVAQELEQISPGLIEETADRDADGNDLGTTTKSVKYSVFVPMLIKGMQEQQAQIEALMARVAALEAA